MITFGLTGGIASGKSTVSRTILSYGIPVVDADVVAREVVEPGTDGLNSIVDMFGETMLLPDGTLDRVKLGELVFSNPDMQLRRQCMMSLNSLMAPLIQEESTRQINKLHAQGHSLVCYDAALIVEMGNADRYRPLVVVMCSPEEQLKRLMSRNSLTREAAMDRISTQMPVWKKIEVADHLINTNGAMDSSIRQTEAVIKKLRELL